MLVILLNFNVLAANSTRSHPEKKDPGQDAPQPTAESPMEFTLVEVVDPEAAWRKGPGILADGEIKPETPSTFRSFLSSHPELTSTDSIEALRLRGQFSTPIIVLNSGGGNLVAGLELGRLIRELGWSTQIGLNIPLDDSHVATDQTVCLSSCTLVFLGGVNRYTNGEGFYGLHRFYSDDGVVRPEFLDVGQKLLADIMIYVRDMGVDSRFVDRWVRVGGKKRVYVMSEDEMIRLGVVTKGYANSTTTWTLSSISRLELSARATVRPNSFFRPGTLSRRAREVFTSSNQGLWSPDDNRVQSFDLTFSCVIGKDHSFQIFLDLPSGRPRPFQLDQPIMISASTATWRVDPGQIRSTPPGLEIPAGSTLDVRLDVPKNVPKNLQAGDEIPLSVDGLANDGLANALKTGDEISVSFGELSDASFDPQTQRFRKIYRFNADLRSGRKEINAVLQRCGA